MRPETARVGWEVIVVKDLHSCISQAEKLNALLLLISETKDWPDEDQLCALHYLALDLSCGISSWLIAEGEKKK